MITITKQEKDIIQAKYPKVPISRTVKKKSNRHHYYMAEEYAAVNLLNSLRGSICDETKKGMG